MSENRKGGCLTWVIILVILGAIGQNMEQCSGPSIFMSKESRVAFQMYDSLMTYARKNCIDRGCGAFSGAARMSNCSITYNLQQHSIKVEYGWAYSLEDRILGNLKYYTEVGSLSDMYISNECGLKNQEDFYPVSIRGRWEPAGSGGGDFIIALAKENRLSVNIFGDGNFRYFENFYFDKPDRLLEIFNMALSKSNKSSGTVLKPFTPADPVAPEVAVAPNKDSLQVNTEIFKSICKIDDDAAEYQAQICSNYAFSVFCFDNCVGLKDKFGNIIIPSSYSSLIVSENGEYACVRDQNGLEGIFGIKNKQMIIPCAYDKIVPLEWSMLEMEYPYDFFSELDPYVLVIKGGKRGAINSDGIIVAPVKYSYIDIYNKLWGKRDGYIDLIESDSIKSIECEDATPCCSSYCLIKRNGLWGVVDDSGNIVIPPEYQEIPEQTEAELFGICDSEYSQNEIIVKNEGKYGLVSLDGQSVLNIDYDYISWCLPYGPYGSDKYVRLIYKGVTDGNNFDGLWGAYYDGSIIIDCKEHFTGNLIEIQSKLMTEIEEKLNLQ